MTASCAFTHSWGEQVKAGNLKEVLSGEYDEEGKTGGSGSVVVRAGSVLHH